MSEYELLERRLTYLDQEVEGEKMVTRHILEQTRRNGDDIAAIRTQLSRMESRLDKVEVGGRATRDELRSLRRELPTMIAETLREVFRERDRET